MVTDFPVDNILVQGAFKVFEESSKKLLLQYAPVIFLVRVLINMFSLRGVPEYVELLKDTMVMFVGIFFFREIMMLILQVPGEAKELVYSFGEPTGISTQSETIKSVLDSPMAFLGFSFSDMDLILGEMLKWIALVVYWIVYWLYFLFIFLAICLSSYVIFFASMFKMRWVLSSFIIVVTIASLWPFLWYGTDYVLTYAISEMARQGSSAGILTSSIVTNLIKIAVPLISFAWAMTNPVGKVSQIGSGIYNTARVLNSPLQKASTVSFNRQSNKQPNADSSYSNLQNSKRSAKFANNRSLNSVSRGNWTESSKLTNNQSLRSVNQKNYSSIRKSDKPFLAEAITKSESQQVFGKTRVGVTKQDAIQTITHTASKNSSVKPRVNYEQGQIAPRSPRLQSAVLKPNLLHRTKVKDVIISKTPPV